MACSSCGGGQAAVEAAEGQQRYTVTTTVDGATKTEEVVGLHAAKVAVTKAGNGRYEQVR